MATLTKEQEQAVAQWAAEGASLNDIQARLNSEFHVNLTYLDARLLVIELGREASGEEEGYAGRN